RVLVPKLAGNLSQLGTAGILMLAGDSYLCDDQPDKAVEQYNLALDDLYNVDILHELSSRRLDNNGIITPRSELKNDSTELSPSVGPMLSQIAERLFYFDQNLAKMQLKRAIVLSEKYAKQGKKVDARAWGDMGDYASKLNLESETVDCLNNEIQAYKNSETVARNLDDPIFQTQCKLASVLLTFGQNDKSIKLFNSSCDSYRKRKLFSESVLLREKFKFACAALLKKESIGKRFYDEAFSDLNQHPEYKTLSALAWCSYAQQLQGINSEEIRTMARESTKKDSSQSDIEEYCRTLIATGHSSDALKLLKTGWGSLDGRIMSYLLLAGSAKEKGNCSESRLYCSKAFELSKTIFPPLTLRIDRELLSKLQLQGCK
ncbi:MAG: hypothetical protein K2X81_11305, partial [Candidatus Obscuribacterales bacterium]|nr:hypothetical protein [Candidatus Obscuribacterales bacterium]